ncbi:T9SS sorting signal type C domain-containing protein [uncultured Flavobacterium sp.]|uniref:T9SS sorting signal type C domain-containing protein n=1 Tax=uncultured Flavobacterium sp. TaxID=165435 RepID=UPI00292FAA96|nr:T9SS sorting signal type C domain-containing protein [uncultured Flavobacterium sp.]
MIRKIFCSLILISSTFSLELYAQQGKVDITFNTFDDGINGDGFDNTVRTLSMQSDENLIVGGDYSGLNGIPVSYLTRLKPDGTIDESFSTGKGFNGKVYASHIQPDGKIIIGGSFTSYNGISSGGLIRLNADGTYDETFFTSIGSVKDIVYNICLQSDGKIIIVGNFSKYNNVTVNRIARLLPNGALDPAFITGVGSSVNITNARVLSNGKILISGNFSSFNGVASNRIVRLNSDGSIDTTFNIGTGFNDDVNAMAVQADGKVILGGSFTIYNEVNANRIIRINENGSIDNSFLSGSGISAGTVQIIKLDFLGQIMVGGSFTGFYNGDHINRVLLLNSDGTLKTDFDMGSGPGNASVLALNNDSEGSWHIGGTFLTFDGLNQGKLAKVTADGEHDSSYLAAGVGFDSSVLKILPLENNKTMVFGSFTKFNGVPTFRITRLLDNGFSDPTFNSGKSGANNLIKSGVLQSDGKIVFGGNFTKYNDINCNRIVRILADGTIDASFNIGTGFNGQVSAIAIQSDEKIIVAGNFITYNGSKDIGRIIRLLPDGSRDTSFNVGLGANVTIEAILIQPDGKILVAGRFNSFNDNTFARLVRLNSNGSIDYGFNIGRGFDNYVYAIALQSDEKIIVGGSFVNYNGISQKRILRLNPDGSLDATFESGTGFSKGDVRSILVQPDDRILVGGAFSGTYKNSVSSRLIRLLKTGSYDASFYAPLNNSLSSMSFTSDYRVLIGGNFNSVSGISKHRIARLKLCLDSTIWNGSFWSNGLPSGGKELFFKENFTSLTAANVCSCSIDEGKTVTLLSGNTLGIEFSYLGLGTLVLEDSASLYQSDDDMINTGIIYFKRKVKPMLRYDFVYWSSPVENQKLIDVSPTTLFDKYKSYDGLADAWKVEAPSNSMIVGKGYSIRAPQEFSTTERSAFEATFKGVPNNGKVEINLETDNGFSLVGNPYPSAVDADTFLTDNTSKIKGVLYFWTHNTPVTNLKYTADDFATFNLLGGVGTSATSLGVTTTKPDGTIAAGQSFFLKSKSLGTVEFTNKMRIRGRNTSFFKPAKEGKEANKGIREKHRIWLNLKNNEGAFKQILVGYINGATDFYDDNYDAEVLSGNQFVDFYSIIENKKLVIQGRALPFSPKDSIVLGYKMGVEGNYSFSIDSNDVLFDDVDVFIKDKDLKIIHNLKERPYLFSTQKGTFNDRFVLCFFNENLKTNNFEAEANRIIVFVNKKSIEVNAVKNSIKDISIFDILGREIYQKKEIKNSKFSIENLSSQNQILLIKVTLENGSNTTHKVIF